VKAKAQAWCLSRGIKDLEDKAWNERQGDKIVTAITVGKSITMRFCLERWMVSLKNRGRKRQTIYQYDYTVRNWLTLEKAFNKHPGAFEERDLNLALNGPRSPKRAPSKRVLHSTLKSFFNYIHDSGWIMHNPTKVVDVNYETMTHLQKEPGVHYCWTQAQIDTFLNGTKLGSFWHTVVTIGIATGMRFRDIASLEWESVSETHITAWTRKRDRRICIPINESVHRAIMAVTNYAGKYLFPNQAPKSLHPTNRCALTFEFRALADSMGIPRCLHDLRRTYITRQAQAGVPLKQIAAEVGHASTTTTEGYIQVVENEQEKT